MTDPSSAPAWHYAVQQDPLSQRIAASAIRLEQWTRGLRVSDITGDAVAHRSLQSTLYRCRTIAALLDAKLAEVDSLGSAPALPSVVVRRARN